MSTTATNKYVGTIANERFDFQSSPAAPTSVIVDAQGGDDLVYGSGQYDLLYGGQGGDFIRGYGGSDTIYGDDYADPLQPGGDDVIHGGLGLELIFAGGGADFVNGEADNDRIEGGNGNDLLWGGGGADIVNGGAGTDVLFGATDSQSSSFGLFHLDFDGPTGGGINEDASPDSGALAANEASIDILDGGAGNDELHGGRGNDTLTGGADRDVFVFDTALSATGNVDRIPDFSVALDTISLRDTIFTKAHGIGGLDNPTLVAAQFFKGAHAHDANDRIIYNPNTGHLSYDFNGNGAGHEVLFARLAAHLAMTNRDFTVDIHG